MIEIPVKDFTTESNRPFRWGNCDVCPLNPPKVVRGFGTSKSGIAVVGESPGTTEVEKGRPFIGPSGQLIRTVLSRLGQNPDDVYWTNALLCHSAKPSKESITACNDRLHEELWYAGAKKILILGGIALQSIVSPKFVQGIINKRGRGFMVRINGVPTYALATYHPAFVLRETELFRDLVFDVEKFLKCSTPIKPPRPHVFVSWTKEQAARRLPPLLHASRLSCDIETTGFSPINDVIISVGFGVERTDGEHEVQIIPSHVLESEEIKPIVAKFFTEYEGTLIFHGGKFDLRMLQHMYNTTFRPKGFSDTLLLHYSLDERASGETTGRTKKIKRHGLKVLSRLYLDAEDYEFDFEEFFAEGRKTKDDYERLFYYQGLDCSYTLQLHGILQPQLGDSENELLRDILYPASFVFQDIENYGIRIDLNYLGELERRVGKEIANIGQTIGKLVSTSTGITDWRTEIQKKKDPIDEKVFNPGSSIQVKKLVYDHWSIPKQVSMSHMAKLRKKQGKDYWPTDHVTLTKLSENVTDPVRKTILLAICDWRERRTVHSTNIVGLSHVVDSDSRLRPSFLLHGTVTGRISASPNVQNIPVRRDIAQSIRTAWAAPENYSLIEADFAQLEVRILAEFSQDPALIKACTTTDIHGDIATRVFNKQAEEISQFERILTKSMVFGTIYGRSAEGILAGEEMVELVKRGMKRWTKDEAESFIRRLLNLYPGMDNYFKRVKKEALEQHYVEYSKGRQRRFPFITNSNRDDVLRQAGNAPIQGTASDICLDGSMRLHEKLKGFDIHILSLIHDSILIECRDDLIQQFLPVIKETMEDVQLFKPTVEYKVKIKVGKDWGHIEEVVV